MHINCCNQLSDIGVVSICELPYTTDFLFPASGTYKVVVFANGREYYNTITVTAGDAFVIQSDIPYQSGGSTTIQLIDESGFVYCLNVCFVMPTKTLTTDVEPPEVVSNECGTYGASVPQDDDCGCGTTCDCNCATNNLIYI